MKHDTIGNVAYRESHGTDKEIWEHAKGVAPTSFITMDDEATTQDLTTQVTEQGEAGIVHYAMSSILIVMMAIILLSNGFLILLFAHDRRLRVATNYFVMCQCACDFCQGLCMPIVIVGMLQPSAVAAPWCLASALLMMLVMSMSFYLQLAIACDRLLAIARPLHYLRLMSLRCSILISLAILLYSIVVSIVLPLIWYETETSGCYRDNLMQPQFYLYIFFPSLGLALFLLTVCYASMFAIARSVKRRQCAMFVPGVHTVTPLEDEMKAARTFLLIIGFNVLTYVSGCVAYFLVTFVQVSDPVMMLCRLLSTLPFLHAAFNPWMYAIRLQPFRMSISRLRGHYSRNHGARVLPHYATTATRRVSSIAPSSSGF